FFVPPMVLRPHDVVFFVAGYMEDAPPTFARPPLFLGCFRRPNFPPRRNILSPELQRVLASPRHSTLVQARRRQCAIALPCQRIGAEKLVDAFAHGLAALAISRPMNDAVQIGRRRASAAGP